MSYMGVRYLGNCCWNKENKIHKLLILNIFVLDLLCFTFFTFEFLLLTSIAGRKIDVLLIMSGRQGAGGFCVTCNAVMEDKLLNGV